jgi:integrase
MPSVWVHRRAAGDGKTRYRVEYRLGGRQTKARYAGTFKTLREAKGRKAWVAGELAAMRVPDLSVLTAGATTPSSPTLAEAGERWAASRVDVASSTAVVHRVALSRALPLIGARRIDDLTAQDVADLVAALHAKGKKRETIRKTVNAVAMVLDHAGVQPNPARDKVMVKLPREEPEEPTPPTAEHVATVYRLLPTKHRLALLWLDWSGARLGSVDETLVGDYDEPRRRVRLRAAVMKGRRAVWVDLPEVLADAIEATLPPREDRDPAARLFATSGADALRTSIGKACRAAGIPVFSPHDLRHRRISLLHLGGMPWAQIGAMVGQRDLAVTANTYTHVMLDGAEVDYAELLT